MELSPPGITKQPSNQLMHNRGHKLDYSSPVVQKPSNKYLVPWHCCILNIQLILDVFKLYYPVNRLIVLNLL